MKGGGQDGFSQMELRMRWRGRGRVAQLCDSLSSSEDVADTAGEVFLQAHRAELPQRRGTAQVAAASVILGGRLHDEWISAEDVATFCRFDGGDVQSTVKLLSSELHLNLPPVDPQTCLNTLVDRLDIDAVTTAAAEEVLARGVEAGLANGRNPAGVAAGAIRYVVSGEELSLAELVDACPVSDTTVRTRYKEFRELDDDTLG
jgi:transcription initiation factor TFIIB